MVISPRHVRGLPDRRPDAHAGKAWLAPRTTGPAGWNPLRDEITPSTGRTAKNKDRLHPLPDTNQPGQPAETTTVRRSDRRSEHQRMTTTTARRRRSKNRVSQVRIQNCCRT